MPVQSTCSRCGADYADWSPRVQEAVLTRFWANVNRDGHVPEYRPDLGVCWLWTGYTSMGYGQMSLNMKRWPAHRLSWELVNGPIPKGLTIDHLCRVTRCVRPDHLEVVTLAENSRRNGRMPWCRRGHDMTPENTIIVKLGRTCRTCHNDASRRRDRVPVAPKPGVLRGERMLNAKLTERAVREIRADHAAGMSIAALARARGLAATTICPRIRCS